MCLLRGILNVQTFGENLSRLGFVQIPHHGALLLVLEVSEALLNVERLDLGIQASLLESQ